MSLADVLTDDLADGQMSKLNVSCLFVLCDPHAREMLLSFPAACDACDTRCLLPAATLCHCSAAQVQLVVLCNHRIRLHCLHLAWAAQAGLAWLGLKSFKLSFVSLCGELASLGYPWLGVAWVPRSNKYYSMKNSTKCPKFYCYFMNCFCVSMYFSPLDEERLEKQGEFVRKSVFEESKQ